MTIVKHSIDAELAEKAVAAAAKKAVEMKLKMCIAVTDEAGDLKAFLRMDG
ncbi:MAG TPA: heme-binding protein, partial [Roseiarcus sp.]|nr:heme-binding protein [Roseiarcus sp.]